jgi:hypothetical protein
MSAENELDYEEEGRKLLAKVRALVLSSLCHSTTNLLRSKTQTERGEDVCLLLSGLYM